MLDDVLSNKRKKTNFKNYKDACNKLQEKEYPRGSKEKVVQIKRWETELNIRKNKDNSFTYINEDFKDQKKIRKEKRIERDTVYIGNHSVFLGAGKYKFERFDNMRDVFLKIIDNTKANSKKGYLKWFYRNCQLYTMIGDEDFRRNYMNSKAKSLAIELFSGQCAYVFESFLKKCRDDLRIYMTYYDEHGNDIDFDSCEAAKKLAAKELDFKFMDYKLRIDELYSRINEILEENELNPIKWKETVYEVNDVEYDKNVEEMRDKTQLYEIIKLFTIKKLKKRSVALGKPRDIKHNLTPVEFREAKEFIEEYVCYYDARNNKYYSIEDIPKTENEKNIM